MTEHPDIATFELFTMGALDDDAVFVAHVAGCEACSAKLAREARLELLLVDVKPRRRSLPKVARIALPFVALAAAAVVLLAMRRADLGAITAETSSAVTGAPGADRDEPPDAESVIAGLRPAFRLCYQAGLRTDLNMEGTVVIEAKVAAAGRVTETRVVEGHGLSETVTHCLAMAAMAAEFAPRGHGSTVRIPLSFLRVSPRR